MISLVYPLQNFPDGAPHPGQISYPFKMVLPDWLPPSMFLYDDNKSQTKLSIQYHLRAQVTPVH